jgi:hypothetical protein
MVCACVLAIGKVIEANNRGVLQFFFDKRKSLITLGGEPTVFMCMAPISEHGTVLSAKACTAILGAYSASDSLDQVLLWISVDHDATVLIQLHESSYCRGAENASVH